jgi:hypothetical protein
MASIKTLESAVVMLRYPEAIWPRTRAGWILREYAQNDSLFFIDRLFSIDY